jgi:apolipoprotein D and lipocalin family protein
MPIRVLILVTASAALAWTACARPPELPVVPQVDLDRYLGTWYEIARYPAWFQRGCTAVTATYTRRDDGLIGVVNECRKGSLDGKLKRATGRARVVDEATRAKLEVSFFGPFWGDYWILALDPDYQWAVVGVPSRKYLWVLSRTPTMSETRFEAAVAGLPDLGFDLARLRRTEQPQPAGD